METIRDPDLDARQFQRSPLGPVLAVLVLIGLAVAFLIVMNSFGNVPGWDEVMAGRETPWERG